MSEPCEAGELTVGEFFRQPIEPECLHEGEMGDFELWQNSAPSCSKGHGGGEGEVLPSLAAGVSIKARGEGSRSARAPSGRRRLVPKPEPAILHIFTEKRV